MTLTVLVEPYAGNRLLVPYLPQDSLFLFPAEWQVHLIVEAWPTQNDRLASLPRVSLFILLVVVIIRIMPIEEQPQGGERKVALPSTRPTLTLGWQHGPFLYFLLGWTSRELCVLTDGKGASPASGFSLSSPTFRQPSAKTEVFVFRLLMSALWFGSQDCISHLGFAPTHC